MNKISIITICYNDPNLERTCESIVNQTWQDFEWIVIDAGSNEQTQQIWDKYKYRINKFVSEPDGGIYYGFNKGLEFATGEYINFLNAGDYYADNNILERVASYGFDKDLIYGDLNLLLDNGNILLKTYPDVVTEDYLKVESLPCPAMFINRELFNKYGNFSTDYKIVSDWEKWIVFICVNKATYKHIPVVCSNFDLLGISSTNPALNAKERELVIKKYFKTSKNSFLEQISSIKNNETQSHKILTILGIRIKIKRRK